MLGSDDRASVLVVGKERVGKIGLFRTWLEREHEVNRPRFVYATSGARLIAGMSGFGQWQERVRRVMEAAHLLDAILYFDDLADLFADRPGGHVDIASAMRPGSRTHACVWSARSREDVLERVEARNGGFFSCFGRVRLEPFDARARAEGPAGGLDRAGHARARTSGADPRRERSARRARRPLPSLRVVSRQGGPTPPRSSEAQRDRAWLEAGGAPIGPDDVHEFFSVRTGVPTFLLRDDRALRVDEVFDVLRKRLVGARRGRSPRRRARVRGEGRPAARGQAARDAPLRRAYGCRQDGARSRARHAALRQRRSPRSLRHERVCERVCHRAPLPRRGRRRGLLTRKVREQLFSVILLDADREGASGDLRSAAVRSAAKADSPTGAARRPGSTMPSVILTSNLGASHRRPQAGFRWRQERRRRSLREGRTRDLPSELVNRIDRIVAFRSLGQDDIRGERDASPPNAPPASRDRRARHRSRDLRAAAPRPSRRGRR